MTLAPDHVAETRHPEASSLATLPQPRGWADGAAWGAAVGVVVGMVGLLGTSTWDVLLGVVLGALSLALVDGIVAVLRAVVRVLIRRPFAGLAGRLARTRTTRLSFPLTGLFLVLGPWVADGTLLAGVTVGAAGSIVIVLATAVGAVLGHLWRRRSPTAWGVALTVVALAVVPLAWLADAGAGSGIVAAPAPAASTTLDLPDPGVPGPFAVRTVTYGSGVNPHRPAFGDDATLRTAPIDGSDDVPAVFNPLHRLHVQVATGATPDRLPIDGTVWLPAQVEAAPLVLVVHGNHALNHASDPGYAYLGRHLASHGYVVVSVDQNFLNGSIAGDAEGAEQPLRARILLEHLRVWEGWASDGGPFEGRVDLQRVALIGHSRGGEAVVHAAAIAQDPSLAPDPSWPTLDDRVVRVEAVAALMPSDGQWQQHGPRRLDGTSYLVLGAGLDGDVTAWQGLAQYHRVDLTPEGRDFAAFAYLQRANHGQANTVWGRDDIGWLNSAILDRSELLGGEEQRRATQMLLTAFLDVTLQGEDGSRAVFTRPDAAHDWLPDDVLVTGYRDATTLPLRRARPATGATAMDDATAMDVLTLRARDGERSLGTTAVRLRWRTGAAPTLRFAVPDDTRRPRADDVLSIAYGGAELGDPPRATVEVEDANGVRVALPIDLATALRPPLPARVAKLPTLAARYGVAADFVWPAEQLLQTYEVPLTAFVATQSALDLDRLVAVTLRPEAGGPASVHVGEVAFRHRTAAEALASSNGANGIDAGR
jgi:dienelactone hydrolase